MTRERIELNGHDESYNPSLDRGRARPWSNGQSAARISAPGREDTSSPSFDFESPDEVQFLRTEKRVPVRRGTLAKKTASRLKTTIILATGVALFGCLAVTAFTYGTHAARFRIESSDSIEISGVHNASRVQVMEVAGSDIGRNIFFVPLEERKKQLEHIPWVESASVMRLLPNRIAVTVAERTPVAFVLLGSRTSLIDASGVIMGPPAGRQNSYRFPVIRGLTENEALSTRAAAMKVYNRLMHELDSGDDAGEHFTRQLSEVDLSDAEDVKATASDDAGTVLIHLGASDFLERYKLYAAHIGEWRRQYHNVQSVDLRYEGQIIVNPDGEHTAQPEPPALKPAAQPKPAVSHPVHASTRHKRQKKGSRK
jgi:cell division protein FtsQ